MELSSVPVQLGLGPEPPPRRRDRALSPVMDQLRRQLVRVGLRLVVLLDVGGLLAALVLLNVVRFGGATASSYPLWEYGLAFLVAAVVHVLVAYFGGLYDREVRLASRPLLPRIAGLALIATLFVGLAELMLARYYIPRLNLFALPAVTTLVLAGNRRLARGHWRRLDGVPRAFLVGAPDEVNLARAHLAEQHTQAMVVGSSSNARDLLAKVSATRATDVLLLSHRLLDEVYPEPLGTLERRGVGVLQRVAARDTLLGLQTLREVAGMPFVALRTHAMPRSRARFKRCLELGAVLVAAPALAALSAFVALYVRVAAGPGTLFRQRRVGRDGAPFEMLKFRTMRPDAEHGVGPLLAQPDDERVITACRWLRATRLDELPQVWNVVRGEMSVVGPRPERPELTAQYERLIPGYTRRHEIPPGITGLAQIHGRYHTDPEYKLGHDLQYLVNWSPMLDLQILCRTVWVVLTRRL